jgi:maltose-binding protein MalE
MSKKNFLKIRILVIAVMVLVACTPTANEEPVVTQALVITEKPTEVPVMTKEPELEIDLACTISLWHSLNEDEFASLDGVLTAFQEIYPDAQFDVLFVPLDDMKGKFETSAGNGGGPSVLIGSSYWGPEFYDSLLIDDVSEFTSNEFLDTISQAALDTVEYKDGLLGLPIKHYGCTDVP